MNKVKGYASNIFHNLDETNYEYFDNGLLLIQDGKILDMGDYDKLRVKYPNLDSSQIEFFKDSLIMPGFIDTHIHYPQYNIIASYGKDLIEWLEKYTFIEEQKFNDIDYANNIAKVFFKELLKNGTTTAMSFCTTHPNSVHAFFNEANRLNLRMIAGKVLMDRNAPKNLLDTPDSAYNQSKELIEQYHKQDRLLYAITPRFAPTSSQKQLKLISKLFKEHNDTYLQSHLNENKQEIAWVKELYPKAKNYLDVYDYYNLLGEKAVYGHCIHGNQEELKRLSQTNTKVALCPSSNLFLGSGLFDINKLEENKITYSLASDIGGGNHFSMFKVLEEAYKIAILKNHNLNSIKAFYLGTLGGAKTLSLENILGNFKKNKEADFIVLSYDKIDILNNKIKIAKTIEEKLFSIMMLGDDRIVSKVFILGDEV